jgi:hypothetical protein
MTPEALQWLPELIGAYNMERIMTLLGRFRSSSDFSFSDFALVEKSQNRQDLPPKDIATVYVNSPSTKPYICEAFAKQNV